MKIAIMQPYFFPYIGYWQLIHAADCFVLLDDVQYIKHGWINRNRILKPGGGWQYVLVPLKKHALTESIKNVQALDNENWKERFIAQLAHYNRKTPYFAEINQIIKDIIYINADVKIAAINFSIIKMLCKYFDLDKKIILSSEHHFDYSSVGDAGEWALRISEQVAASEYINPIAGKELFSKKKFSSCNIKLSFLRSDDIVYSQRGSFEASLSIIDVLMFNGIERTKELLKNYHIEHANECPEEKPHVCSV